MEDISVWKGLQAGARYLSITCHVAQAVNNKPGGLQSLLQAVKSGLDLSILDSQEKPLFSLRII